MKVKEIMSVIIVENHFICQLVSKLISWPFIRDHKCDHCGKCFSQSGSLKLHIKAIHEGQRDHKCQHCEQSFAQSGNLSRHIRAVHESRKDHKCDHCGKCFSEYENLKRHIKTIHESIAS